MRKICQLEQFVTPISFPGSGKGVDGIQASVAWIEGSFADVEARFDDFERADVVEASFEDFERNWICCRLFFKVSYIILNTDYCYGRLNLLVNHFLFLKEPFDMFRFTITELKRRHRAHGFEMRRYTPHSS